MPPLFTKGASGQGYTTDNGIGSPLTPVTILMVQISQLPGWLKLEYGFSKHGHKDNPSLVLVTRASLFLRDPEPWAFAWGDSGLGITERGKQEDPKFPRVLLLHGFCLFFRTNWLSLEYVSLFQVQNSQYFANSPAWKTSETLGPIPFSWHQLCWCTRGLSLSNTAFFHKNGIEEIQVAVSDKNLDFWLTPELLHSLDGYMSQQEQLIIFDQHKLYL